MLVDLSPSCATESQYHFALEMSRHIVEAVPYESRPVVVFVVHFPPELAQLGALTTSVPTGNWRFCYCDSLGVASAATFEGTGMRVIADSGTTGICCAHVLS